MIFRPLSYSYYDNGEQGASGSRVRVRRGSMAVRLVHLVFVLEGLLASFVEKTRADEGFCDRVGVTVGRRAPVFKVTLLLLADSPGNADAGAPVGHARGKVVDVGGFVEAGQAAGVVQAPLGIVGADVVLVPLAQSLDGLFNIPREDRKVEGPTCHLELSPSRADSRAGMDAKTERLIYHRLLPVSNSP